MKLSLALALAVGALTTIPDRSEILMRDPARDPICGRGLRASGTSWRSASSHGMVVGRVRDPSGGVPERAYLTLFDGEDSGPGVGVGSSGYFAAPLVHPVTTVELNAPGYRSVHVRVAEGRFCVDAVLVPEHR
jgi:hypothetical protein